jgi:beta-lactamase class A
MLDLTPIAAAPAPTTWAGVDAALRSAAPQVRLLVADVSAGSCRPVHGIDPDTAAPIGSAFKLYVLHALGTAVAAGTVRWDQPLTVTAQVKSLPSGVLQNEPDGTQISVRDAAAKMIAISDNTATDMLINLMGRSAVEAALTTTGMARPALNRPLLTTRETFILAFGHHPALAQRYLTATEAGRRALLSGTVDRLALPTLADAQAASTSPDGDNLGPVASARDLCHAYTSLAALSRRPGVSPIGQALSLNDGGLDLDPAQWTTTWYKGGGGPGLLVLAYLATTHTGHSYVVTVLAENRSQPIDEATILTAVKGAFMLAARR